MSRRIAILFVLACLLQSGWSFAQGEPEAAPEIDRVWQAAFKRGNTAYNEEKYDEAREAYIQALQAQPMQAQGYRNLARTYFWMGRYSAATAYYDFYLRLAPTAADLDQIKAERRLAAERAGDAVWTLPEAQRLTLSALEKELESGRAYTSGGGGAWGLYETLLRTGYAEPALRQVRARLVRRVLDEFEAYLLPESGHVTPKLDLEGWQLQAERLSAARSLSSDPAVVEMINRRSTIVEAAIAMLTGQPADAAELARLARTSNPDMSFVRWFEIVSLLEANQPREALESVEAHARELASSGGPGLDYARVLRAVALQRLDRDEDAAGIYMDLLADDP